ncbi:MAG: hypothetical protein SOZ97_05560 [Lachnospiraceae bacterium]|nr:hypothetical protein [Lachnospiraceae bacterium]
MLNHIVYGAGCTPESAVLRRLPRMTQTSIEQYLLEAEADEK